MFVLFDVGIPTNLPRINITSSDESQWRHKLPLSPQRPQPVRCDAGHQSGHKAGHKGGHQSGHKAGHKAGYQSPA